MNMEIFLGTCLSVAIIFSCILFIGFVWFVVQFKRQKKVTESSAQTLEVGNDVLFASGVYGKIIKRLDADTFLIEVSKGVNLKVSQYSIQAVVRK